MTIDIKQTLIMSSFCFLLIHIPSLAKYRKLPLCTFFAGRYVDAGAIENIKEDLTYIRKIY